MRCARSAGWARVRRTDGWRRRWRTSSRAGRQRPGAAARYRETLGRSPRRASNCSGARTASIRRPATRRRPGTACAPGSSSATSRSRICGSTSARTTSRYRDGEPGGRAITVGSLLTAILTTRTVPSADARPGLARDAVASPGWSWAAASPPAIRRSPRRRRRRRGDSPYGSTPASPARHSNICNALARAVCMAAPAWRSRWSRRTPPSCCAATTSGTSPTRGWCSIRWSRPGQPVDGRHPRLRHQRADRPGRPPARCPPHRRAPTFNRAHFRVPANEGAFYKLRLFNHNGTFLTQADGLDDGAPRVIHTCFPTSPVGRTTCRRARCATAPRRSRPACRTACRAPQPGRAAAQARGLPPPARRQPPCGETPEWYEAELLSPRVQGPTDGRSDRLRRGRDLACLHADRNAACARDDRRDRLPELLRQRRADDGDSRGRPRRRR